VGESPEVARVRLRDQGSGCHFVVAILQYRHFTALVVQFLVHIPRNERLKLGFPLNVAEDRKKSA
jgi:hypothetical protein